MNAGDGARPVTVDYAALDPDTLSRLIEEFVTRDGTDYGEIESTLESRAAEVLAQLKGGKALITFDLATQTATIVPSGERA